GLIFACNGPRPWFQRYERCAMGDAPGRTTPPTRDRSDRLSSSAFHLGNRSRDERVRIRPEGLSFDSAGGGSSRPERLGRRRIRREPRSLIDPEADPLLDALSEQHGNGAIPVVATRKSHELARETDDDVAPVD